MKSKYIISSNEDRIDHNATQQLNYAALIGQGGSLVYGAGD